jgi:hypothetical protein
MRSRSKGGKAGRVVAPRGGWPDKVSSSNLPEAVAGVRDLPSKKFPGLSRLEASECIGRHLHLRPHPYHLILSIDLNLFNLSLLIASAHPLPPPFFHPSNAELEPVKRLELFGPLHTHPPYPVHNAACFHIKGAFIAAQLKLKAQDIQLQPSTAEVCA